MSPCCHGSVGNTGELLSTRQKGTVSTAFPPLLRSSHTHGFITLITILSTCFGRSSPVLSEREKEKCAGSLLFFEGCTGFNSQIIIYSLIFVTLPDSCAHCKKIRLILLIYLHQLLSNLFSTFPFSVNLFLHFHLNILYFIDRDTILSNSLTLNKFLCPVSSVYELCLKNPMLSTTSLLYCASSNFMAYKLLWCSHLSILLSFLYCISYD